MEKSDKLKPHSDNGTGFVGVGKYKTSIKQKPTKMYSVWKSMLRRYKDCSVDSQWCNFQVFAKWHEKNYNPETMKGWHLDKDILVKGNKIYSPKTCCFVPFQINSLFANVTKHKGDCYV
jgi:hypothetical protein